MNNNKPLALQSPATVMQALMDLVPSGASVSVQLPIGQRQLNVSQRIVDMRQDLYVVLAASRRVGQ